MLNKEIQELCLAATQEADPEKLLSLVDRLNQALATESDTSPDKATKETISKNPARREGD